jgi:hypothetical protein
MVSGLTQPTENCVIDSRGISRGHVRYPKLVLLVSPCRFALIGLAAGTAVDVGHLSTFLPAYLFPDATNPGGSPITTWVCAGVSLGGHTTWLAGCKSMWITSGSASAVPDRPCRSSDLALDSDHRLARLRSSLTRQGRRTWVRAPFRLSYTQRRFDRSAPIFSQLVLYRATLASVTRCARTIV